MTGPNVCDGKSHHAVAKIEADGKSVSLWLDGNQVGSNTAAAPLDFTGLCYSYIGGVVSYEGFSNGAHFPGTIARVALYPTALSGTRIAAHYKAGATGFTGESSGTRIGRILDYAGWPSAKRTVQTGVSVMGPALLTGKNAFQALKDVTTTEGGLLFINPSGNVEFRSRDDRWMKTTATYVLGDGPGEIPFNEDAEFDGDPDQIYNDVTVARAGGATVRAVDGPSTVEYGTRTLPLTSYASTDAEAADKANWTVAQYKDPKVRVQKIKLDPAANPAIFPTALGIGIGDRVTLHRRSAQADVSGDFFVELKEPTGDATTFEVALQLSPADTPHAALWDTDVWDDPNAVWGY